MKMLQDDFHLCRKDTWPSSKEVFQLEPRLLSGATLRSAAAAQEVIQLQARLLRLPTAAAALPAHRLPTIAAALPALRPPTIAAAPSAHRLSRRA